MKPKDRDPSKPYPFNGVSFLSINPIPNPNFEWISFFFVFSFCLFLFLFISFYLGSRPWKYQEDHLPFLGSPGFELFSTVFFTFSAPFAGVNPEPKPFWATKGISFWLLRSPSWPWSYLLNPIKLNCWNRLSVIAFQLWKPIAATESLEVSFFFFNFPLIWSNPSNLVLPPWESQILI